MILPKTPSSLFNLSPSHHLVTDMFISHHHLIISGNEQVNPQCFYIDWSNFPSICRQNLRLWKVSSQDSRHTQNCNLGFHGKLNHLKYKKIEGVCKIRPSDMDLE